MRGLKLSKFGKIYILSAMAYGFQQATETAFTDAEKYTDTRDYSMELGFKLYINTWIYGFTMPFISPFYIYYKHFNKK